jgi:hypothetical protein
VQALSDMAQGDEPILGCMRTIVLNGMEVDLPGANRVLYYLLPDPEDALQVKLLKASLRWAAAGLDCSCGVAAAPPG